MNQVYLSTGAFIGKRNGFDFDLLINGHSDFICDGFEFMMFRNMYDRLGETVGRCRAENIKIPVIHADKRIGDLFSEPDDESFSRAVRLFEDNCRTAQRLGADRIVVHCWGVPESDRDPSMIYERIGSLLETARANSVEMLTEGIFCVHKSPLFHMKKLSAMYPGIGFTVDMRCSQFHRELPALLEEKELWAENIRHIHISDYSGPKCDWSKIYPIYQPGKGDINWRMVFERLRSKGYSGSFTLESPAILPEGTDVRMLNESMAFIRNGITGRYGRLPPDKSGLYHSGTCELESRRLKLRRFVIEDYPDMFANWSGSTEAMRFQRLPAHVTPAKAKFQIQRLISSYRSDSFYNWAIEEKSTGRLIGSIFGRDLSNRFKSMRIEYVFDPSVKGNGYEVEALSAAFSFLFKTVNFRKLYICVDMQDTATLAVVQELEMMYESLLSEKEQHGNGIRYDAHLFSMIRSEWELKEKQAAMLLASSSIPGPLRES